jgi:hypothetical protein
MTIKRENARPGEAEWWSPPHAPQGAIEGYCTQPSVVAGDPLALCVSTDPAARYEARVYRLGWYGGAGARRVATLGPNVGLARPVPSPDPETGINRAGWPVTDVVTTAEDWPTGQYAAMLVLTGGPHAGSAARIPFVVRALPGAIAPVLVQTPINTAQAYNHWGGKCLYVSNSTDQIAAVKVSFDRPVLSWDTANLNSRAPFTYEYPLLRWLERESFEVDYQTNVDTHRDPYTLVGRRLIITAGHDEYWTAEMRTAFDEALAAGTNMAFMGANTCYWQIRYEDAERTMVEYRDASLDPDPDPAGKTIRFRHLHPPRPERELMGIQYEGGLGHPREVRDFRFDPGFAADPWAQGVALEPERPLHRLVGYEWDTFDEEYRPPGLVRIMRGEEGADAPADCVRWTHPSGAHVFSAGSLQLAWALDDWASADTADDRVQGILRTAFTQMAR